MHTRLPPFPAGAESYAPTDCARSAPSPKRSLKLQARSGHEHILLMTALRGSSQRDAELDAQVDVSLRDAGRLKLCVHRQIPWQQP
ncbi:Hypothetical protein SMAX5B_017574 [Scophthalmus maximus]|uniref:Uncharacterized protein n=1 Tax=Scophthalmus maximus TaxID=52904 RepID=A0A2U9C8K3_SCOMX|nr:Hypothetical protein SMAX5B_017574 [Scophthalmus maximus]